MKAHLSSVRIAPKKANVIAKLVRGMTVSDAVDTLERTHKKGARIMEKLLKSAEANAVQNDKQDPSKLVIRTVVVNQGPAYQRGIPRARGSVRPILKFLSHITVTLGVAGMEEAPAKKAAPAKKQSTPKKEDTTAKTSQKKASTVQKKQSTPKKTASKPTSSAQASSDNSAATPTS